MIFLTIVDASGKEKFFAKGERINAVYNGLLSEGSKIKIRVDGGNVIAVKLDPTLQESLLYSR